MVPVSSNSSCRMTLVPRWMAIILDRRHEIDEDAFLMFFSIRALLRKGGTVSREPDQEAGRIMARLKL